MKKTLTNLLTLLGVFLFLGAGKAWAITVYFTNPSGWDTPYVWIWQNENANNNATEGSWPGKPMTKEGNVWKYEVKGYDNVDRVIFSNNGADQKGNFIFIDGATYDNYGPQDQYIGWYLMSADIGWLPKLEYQFKPTSNQNEYSLQVDNLVGGFKVVEISKADITWNTAFTQSNNENFTGTFKMNEWYQCTKQENADRPAIPHTGTTKNATITINPSTYKVKVEEPVTYPSSLYLIRGTNGYNTTTGTEITGTNGVYSGRVTIGTNPGTEKFQFVEKLDVNNGTWDVGQQYKPKQGNGQHDGDKATYYFEGIYSEQTTDLKTSKENGEFALPAGTYDITLDIVNMKATFKLVTLIYPTYLYMYGDLKDSDWSVADPYAAKGENGVYTFNAVSIYGNNDDPNHNYFSFFFNRANDTSYTQQLPRVTALKGTSGNQNNYDFGKLTRDQEYRADASVHCFNQANSDYEYNFKIDKGYYDVVVDLTKPEVRIKLRDIITFDWHNGNGDKLTEDAFADIDGTDFNESENVYTVDYSPAGRRVQVGVDDDAQHDAANKAEFKVMYSPNYASAQSSRRKADASFSDVTQDKSVCDITEGNVVYLYKVGTYEITAQVPEDLQDIYPGPEDNPTNKTTLTTVVQPASLTAYAEETISEPFTNYLDEKIDLHAVSLGLSGLKLGTDFTITIEPQDATNWVKVENYSSSTTTEQIDAVYKENIPTQSVYEQYLNAQAGSYSSTSGKNYRVDGVYTEVSNITAPESSVTAGDYDISAEFPCSGVYVMKIEPVENGNVSFNGLEIPVTITPNIELMYNTVPGFNIRGYGITATNLGQIDYPTVEATTQYLKNCVAYTPGIYFDTDFTITVNNTTTEAVREGNNNDWNVFDFTALASQTSAAVTVKVTKNGASDSWDILVNKDNNVATSVDPIGAAEDGEAVYFNLQGVRVQNPERGLYIKVCNGKSEKIFIQ